MSLDRTEGSTVIATWCHRCGPSTLGVGVAIVPEQLRSPVRWTRACGVDEVPLDGALHVLLEDLEICLANGGRFYALLDECSHGQVRLSEGDV